MTLRCSSFTHVCLPVEAETRTAIVFPRSGRLQMREPGDLLWPARDGRAELETQQQMLGPAAYAGQYQQRPAPRGGAMFKGVWFQPMEALPATAGRAVRFWDIAGTVGGTGARTAGVRIVQAGKLFIITKVVKDRVSAAGVDTLMTHTAALDTRDTSIREEQEPGSAGKAVCAARASLLAGFDYKGTDANTCVSRPSASRRVSRT